MSRKRVLSGMQASGKLHIGHLDGVLSIWTKLQDEFECFYFIADWHALSTSYEDTHLIKENIFNIAVDWLSAGVDPEKSVIFLQSKVSEHAELFLLLSMITPVPWLERNPTFKEKMQEIKGKDLTTLGFLGYPVLQAADIMLYNADYVPVGIDQLPHLEMTRELARRFNHIYKKQVLVEPQPKLSKIPKILGLDGRKMSKSYNNAIYISDEDDTIQRKVMKMVTDPQRIRKTDPGNPEICNVFALHKIYTPTSEIAEIHVDCMAAKIGCTDCKLMLARDITARLKPIREKRNALISKPDIIYDILDQGSKKAKVIASLTLTKVKEAMCI